MYENRVELMGFLGKSPESKSTKKTGRTLAILSLATKTWWKDKDEQPQEKTEWHRIIVWNGLAEYAADKLKKGAHLWPAHHKCDYAEVSVMRSTAVERS